MRFRHKVAVLTVTVLSQHIQWAGAADRVFVLNNSPMENAVMEFRHDRGEFSMVGKYPTSGRGTGGGLGNQAALAFSPNRRFLLAVNPGTDTVSSMRFGASSLELVDTVSAGGERPVSVAAFKRWVYVLNAGAPNTIAGFRITSSGHLRPIPESTRTLSQMSTGPAQIGFSPDGKAVVVTEKATNLVVTFAFDEETGLTGTRRTVQSPGDTPFGFAFHRDGALVVSEAVGGTASSLSSYEVRETGALRVMSPAVPAGDERAACWVVLSPNGRFAYTTNTASDSVSLYRLSDGSDLAVIADVAAATGAGPTDLDINPAGNTVVVLNAASGTLSSYSASRSTGLLEEWGESDPVLEPGMATGLLMR
jgi:6-phosphogluconolactonase